jgi:hypothetical protein
MAPKLPGAPNGIADSETVVSIESARDGHTSLAADLIRVHDDIKNLDSQLNAARSKPVGDTIDFAEALADIEHTLANRKALLSSLLERNPRAAYFAGIQLRPRSNVIEMKANGKLMPFRKVLKRISDPVQTFLNPKRLP